MPDPVTSSSGQNKRPRPDPRNDGLPPVGDNAFIQDNDAVDSGGDDDEEEDGRPKDKKAGRRKIKIEFIQDKSRRHITFSKRKAGIMKKAYELSTLTGTQVLLLVVSETGLVYTFTTAKLQPLVTQPEGKNLIQACLNAPHGQLPSQMPVGSTISRSGAPGPQPMATAAQTNVSGGLTIGPGGQKDEDGERDEADRANKRRRRGSGAAQSTNPPPNNNSAANNRAAPPQSPHSPNAPIPAPAPPPMNIPGQRPGAPPQMMSGSPPQSHTHPHTHQAPQNTYAHPSYPGQPQQDLYAGQPMMGPAGYGYTQPQGGQGPPQNSLQQGGQQWAQAVPQNSHYTRR